MPSATKTTRKYKITISNSIIKLGVTFSRVLNNKQAITILILAYSSLLEIIFEEYHMTAPQNYYSL